jgi:uncharacterized protein YndB with AHSA1/START domain
MTSLPYLVDRVITIGAPRELVFEFLSQSDRWAAWWGAGSTIDPQTGGRVLIRHPGGIEVIGEVREIDPPAKIVFTYGHAAGTPIAPGGSIVTIALEPVEAGTRLHLRHAVGTPALREEFVQGWRFQLALFANAVANAVHASPEPVVDGWFAAWALPDVEARQRALDAVAVDGVRFQDRFSCTDGLADLMPHITAALRFMPGMRIERRGSVRHCQGTALADWVAVGPDGAERGSGTNVFTLGPDGRITSAVGLWKT